MKKYIENQIIVPRFNEENGFYTTQVRSDLMSRIKSQNTKPEQIMRKALWDLGYRYRKNVKTLPGKPDIVFFRFRLAIFIDGEFWHGYNWNNKKNKIKANRDFWIPKIERNMQRDAQNNCFLAEKGYQVIRFGDNEILKNLDHCLSRVIEHINRKIGNDLTL